MFFKSKSILTKNKKLIRHFTHEFNDSQKDFLKLGYYYLPLKLFCSERQQESNNYHRKASGESI